MVTRRALLGAGTLLLVGCGPPDEPEVDAATVWGEQLRVSQAALAAYPSNALRSAAERRVKQLEPLAGATGTAPTATPSLEAALSAERRALQAHVAAVGELSDRASRELLGTLIAGTAEAVSALRAELDEPPIVDSFPGQRNRP